MSRRHTAVLLACCSCAGQVTRPLGTATLAGPYSVPDGPVWGTPLALDLGALAPGAPVTARARGEVACSAPVGLELSAIGASPAYGETWTVGRGPFDLSAALTPSGPAALLVHLDAIAMGDGCTLADLRLEGISP